MAKVYPNIVKPSSEERMHSYLTESLLKRVSAVVDKKYGQTSGTCSNSSFFAPTKSSSNKKVSPRDGGIESYHLDKNVACNIHARSCVRGYKVLSFVENEKGIRTVFDLLTGTVYNAGRTNRITNGGVLFSSKSAAMSERFSPKMLPIANSSLPTSRYPRVLCKFDGWGKVQNRFGGIPAAEYEYVKFMGVVQFIDPICPHTQNGVDYKREPYFFAKPDKTIAPRNSSPISVKIGAEPLGGK